MRDGGRAFLSRRSVLALAGAAAAAPLLPPFAWAAGKSGLHGLSIFGELKYPADFKHFDYVDPAAPKGGRMNFSVPYWLFNQNVQTFNTLNSFVLKGDSPPRMELIFDTLMARAIDEPDAVYGLLAESVAVSEDRNTYTFTLRPEARFHDGSPLTAEDVAFSLDLLKQKGHPQITEVIGEFTGATATDPRTVVLTLSGKQGRDLILTLVGLPIFSKAFYATRDFEASTLEPPLGSSAYKVGAVSAGRYIEYERVPDYWGKDLPVNVGSANFDVIRLDFYRDRQAGFEAFKKGDTTYREEFTSKAWATEYNFPAITTGKVKQTQVAEEKRPDVQAWYPNGRRPKYADPRTRRAIGLCFDFEWTNRNIFYGAYTRAESYFEKSDFVAEGPPSPDEVALLEPFRGQLPEEVFGTPVPTPKSDGSGRDRKLLQRASQLLAEAGWKNDGTVLRNERGEALTAEFLIDDNVFEKSLSPFVANLRAIGVDASIRLVDPTQYTVRTNDFDYDIVMNRVSLAATPLDGLNTIYGSKSANTPGTYNLAGISDPAIDALIDRVPKVSTRAELVTLLRAMDRILRARHYAIPNWVLANHRVAHWDIFDAPAIKPDYAFTPETLWWFARDKAVALGMAG